MNEFAEASAKSTQAPRLGRDRLRKAAQNGLLRVILVLLAYYALFRLPFRFPPRERMWSASYAFGFNNGVAIVALAGLLIVVTLLHIRRGRFTGKIETVSDENRASWTAIKVVFAIACIAYAG
jgi:hypothetical protein